MSAKRENPFFVRELCGENTALRHAQWRLGRGGGSCALGVDRRRSIENTGSRGEWVWPGSRGERVRGGCTEMVGRSLGERGETKRRERTGTLG